ncbi:MAG: alpha/beta hydrolase [Pirellulaceae bacterium]
MSMATVRCNVMRSRRFVFAVLVMMPFAGIQMPGSECAAQRSRLQIPDPEVVTLETKDGCVLQCTFYPGGFLNDPKKKQVTKVPGKEVAPIIMLHGWKGQRSELDRLAHYLQMLGHAVIVPDLRGHGGSTRHRFSDRPIELKRPDYSMSRDVDAVKKFLMERNNEGELNIELLTIVGADLGAILAVNWAAQDWSWPQLPSFKQGRDVKALVLLSPKSAVMGMTLNKALQHPAVMQGLSIFIAVGKRDRAAYTDATKTFSRLERARSNSTEGKESLKLIEPDTSLSGTKLLTARGIGNQVSYEIAAFIYRRIVSKKSDFKWTKRENPLAPSE